MTSPLGEVEEGKHLHGKYKTFFKPSAHELVEQWYNSKTTQTHRRRNMKQLVKNILEFDPHAAKARLRATDRADVIGANAIYDQHNGELLLSADAAEKTVRWLSFASPCQKQMFRDTFGHMKPCTMFSSSRQYTDDFSLENKITPSDQRTQKTRGLLGTDFEYKRSGAITSETLSIGRHPTSTGTNFVWKVQPQLALNVQQCAHDASFKGAPWGDYGNQNSSNNSQWQSKSTEDFNRTQYDGPPDRSFQNYNENFCTELYKSSKKAAKVQKMKAEVDMFRASQSLKMNPPTPGVDLGASEQFRAGSAGVESVTGGDVGVVPALSSSKRERPQSMLEVGMTALLTQERKYRPKMRQPVNTPAFRKPKEVVSESDPLLLLGTQNAPPPRLPTTLATEMANAKIGGDAPPAGGKTTAAGAKQHDKFAKVSGVGIGAGKTPDHGLDPEFVEMAMRIRQSNFPRLHTGLKRRKTGMSQFHSRE